jgi:hypothetical protein
MRDDPRPPEPEPADYREPGERVKMRMERRMKSEECKMKIEKCKMGRRTPACRFADSHDDDLDFHFPIKRNIPRAARNRMRGMFSVPWLLALIL